MSMPYLNNMICNILNGAWSLIRSKAMEITQVLTPTIPILILSFLVCIFMFWQPWKKTALPPGPRGLPVVGYIPFLEGNFFQQLRELARQYGPIYKMKIGRKLWVVVTSPSIAKELIRDQDMLFAKQDLTTVHRIFFRRGLDISLDPPSSQWRNMRRIVRELLRKSNLDANYDLRKVELRKAIRLLSSKVGRPIDVGQFMRTTNLDALMSMAWGRTIEAEDIREVGSELSSLLDKFGDLIRKPNISDIFPLIARFDIQGVAKESKVVLQSVDEILDRIMNRGMERMETKAGDTTKDFFQLLLKLWGSEGHGPGLKTQIKSSIRGILFGATDTTSTIAKLVMTEIAHNREVMQKVQKELEDVVGLNNIVEGFHLSKLQYLDAVVKETFRLHPTAPLLIPRRPAQSCTLAGYTIPKDSKIYVNVWEIQRDPQLWENPLDFKPERFLNETVKWDFWGKDIKYIPFGSGIRVCPGIPLAERMLMYTLASLLHSFDWQAIETKETDLSETPWKGKPLMAIPTKRLPDSGLYT